MAWRVLEVGGEVWTVSIAAERRADSDRWELVLSFRAAGPERRSFWKPYPIVAVSRSVVYTQAERIPDQELNAILAEHLS